LSTVTGIRLIEMVAISHPLRWAYQS